MGTWAPSESSAGLWGTGCYPHGEGRPPWCPRLGGVSSHPGGGPARWPDSALCGGPQPAPPMAWVCQREAGFVGTAAWQSGARVLSAASELGAGSWPGWTLASAVSGGDPLPEAGRGGREQGGPGRGPAGSRRCPVPPPGHPGSVSVGATAEKRRAGLGGQQPPEKPNAPSPCPPSLRAGQ